MQLTFCVQLAGNFYFVILNTEEWEQASVFSATFLQQLPLLSPPHAIVWYNFQPCYQKTNVYYFAHQGQTNIQQLFLTPQWALSVNTHEAEGRMEYDSARGHKGKRNNNIVLVKFNQLVKNMETKQHELAKQESAAIVLVFKAGAYCYQWAITYSLVVVQPIRTQHS